MIGHGKSNFCFYLVAFGPSIPSLSIHSLALCAWLARVSFKSVVAADVTGHVSRGFAPFFFFF
jgi:hypothetical protein